MIEETHLPRTAILGGNGFIGSHLLSRMPNTVKFTRDNIGELGKDASERLIIAAAPAAKWFANSNPEEDLANIKTLVACIRESKHERTILISTVDVFPVGQIFDENSPTSSHNLEAYGRNRLFFEQALSEFIPHLQIVRLPGLFGPGLKKNLIFDLMNGRPGPLLNRDTKFQFYDVRSLVGHLEILFNFGIKIAHLATEPISVKEIYQEIFHRETPRVDTPRLEYRMKTRLSYELAGRKSDYILSKSEVVSSLLQWKLEMAQR